MLLPIEQYEHPQASWAFIKGKQSLSLPLSILADHIGKIPKEARVFAYAIPPINRVSAVARSRTGEDNIAIPIGR